MLLQQWDLKACKKPKKNIKKCKFFLKIFIFDYKIIELLFC